MLKYYFRLRTRNYLYISGASCLPEANLVTHVASLANNFEQNFLKLSPLTTKINEYQVDIQISCSFKYICRNEIFNILMQGRVQFAIELRGNKILIEDFFLKCHCFLSDIKILLE
jgi:hypothetical protein